MLDTYTGREKETLEVLKIYPIKTLAFEEKLPKLAFEDYDSSMMVVKLNFWLEGLESLAEEVLKPEKVKVKKDLSMDDFKATISA